MSTSYGRDPTAANIAAALDAMLASARRVVRSSGMLSIDALLRSIATERHPQSILPYIDPMRMCRFLVASGASVAARAHWSAE